MVAPLIFVPNGHGFGESLFSPLGLQDHVIGCEFVQGQSGPGPDGKPVKGVMCGWRKPTDTEKRLEYSADEQVWIPADPVGDLQSGRYWMGLWKHSPPTPDDLLRQDIFDGYRMKLGEAGHAWQIPTAARLPRNWRRNGTDGTIEKVVQKRFQEFWDSSIEWFELLMGVENLTEGVPRSESEWWDYCLYALRLHYRLTDELAGHLQLIDDHTRLQIVLATIDGHQIERVKEAIMADPTSDAPVQDMQSSTLGAKV